MKISRITLCTILILAFPLLSSSQYLHSNLSATRVQKTELSSRSARYSPLFGKGTDSASLVKGLLSYGALVLDPGGKSGTASTGSNEIVLYIMRGKGTLSFSRKRRTLEKDDFLYLPAGNRFRITNGGDEPLSLLVMTFPLFAGDTVKASPVLQAASATGVPFQVLGYHGPTTTFQLLMGTSTSTRDRLAASSRVSSLFVMDFAAGGTNIPHRHEDEEEIYLIIRGKGDIVAGQLPDGSEARHPSAAGDAWFFSPGTLIGFYSGNTAQEDHARILAVRFRYP